MSQHLVLRHAYDSLFELLGAAGQSIPGYAVCKGSSDGVAVPESGAVARLSVSDVCQFSQDKNGQRIVVDEMLYEMPSMVSFIARVTVRAREYDELLGAVGAIIGTLKDHSVIAAGERNWHGNDSGNIYVEPVIRDSVAGKAERDGDIPSLALEYRIECGINSAKGEKFTRVDKRDVRSEVMG